MRTYDFAMTHALDADDFFIHRVQQNCAERGQNFFLIEPEWAEAFLEKLEAGRIFARVVLNMHSEHHRPDDIFHRLVAVADRRGAFVIDPPFRAADAFNKAMLHPRLAAEGFKLPETVIVEAEKAAAFFLSDEQRPRLGLPFVIKPARGYGKRGVILDAVSEADIHRSIAQWPDVHYLVQKRITARKIRSEPAYFRTFYAFGSVWPCWWNCHTDRYRALTEEEMSEHSLQPLGEIARRLAALTGMNFFSSEISLTEEGEFVLIDYVNDQCHMLSQSASPQIGVPDAVVAAIAKRLVEGAFSAVGEKREG